MKRLEQESEYQRLLMKRYGHLNLDKLDSLSLDGLYEDPQTFGYEHEMLEWLKTHPDATFQELVAFDFSFYEPLEIVDDDEPDSEGD